MKTAGLTGYEIRQATPADVPELIRMQAALQESTDALQHNLLGFNAAKGTRLHEYYLARLEDEQTRLLIAQTTAPPEVVGMGTGQIWLHADCLPPRSGEILDVWIDPAHRRQNLATRIITDLVRFFNASGIDLLVVNYVQGNRLGEEFWRKLRFAPVLATATADRTGVETALGIRPRHRLPFAYREAFAGRKGSYTHSVLSG